MSRAYTMWRLWLDDAGLEPEAFRTTTGKVHACVLGGIRDNGEVWLHVPCGIWANADTVDYTDEPLTCLVCIRITTPPEGTP